MLLRRIHPDAGAVTLEEAARAVGLRERAPADRPFVALNMVATVDGRASVGGSTTGMGGPADRALFHALRAEADAVLVGAGTARAERYGRLVRDPAVRSGRAARGLAPDPLLCVVSGRLDLPGDLPFLHEPDQPAVVLTESEDVPAPPAAGALEVVRARPLDLAGALGRLRRRRGVRGVLCEGGPTLNRELLALGLVDVLLLTLAPDLSGAEAPTIVAPGLPEPRSLVLERALEHDGALLLSYAVGA